MRLRPCLERSPIAAGTARAGEAARNGLLTIFLQKELRFQRGDRMRGFILAVIIATPLGACANLQTTVNDSDCRHLLSPYGEPLRFCETGNQITVDDKPIDVEHLADERLIDDPKFLAAMVAQLPKPQIGSRKRRTPAAQICKSARPGYITIAASDLAALIHARADIAAPGVSTTSTPLSLQAEEANSADR